MSPRTIRLLSMPLSMPLSMLLGVLLIVALAGCVARQPRCDSRLRPINLAPTASAAGGHRPVTHE